MCVDYRTLNKLTIRDNFPLPLIEDCLEYLSGKKYFSLLDLKSGFHQVPVDEDSIKFTSFVTPSGQYEYLRMPFGLKNAPSVFQRFIYLILKEFITSGQIIVYMDDILLGGATFDEHHRILGEVLKCLALSGIQLQLNKCQFAYQEFEYLGFRISPAGISPGTQKTKAIHRFPVPTDVRRVLSFLGLCSYFRKFIPNFALVANPLYRLLRKEVAFEFDDSCARAFETLKQLLTSLPVICVYDPSRETELHTDASKIGFGAVLLQRQDDNKFHPVAFFSKTASDCESRYHSYELETLAIVYALDRFRVYLTGIAFTIISDCNSLVLTFNKKDVNPRIARWVWEFQRFNFRIKHRSGDRMPHADALSRNPIVGLVNSDDFNLQLQVTQARDPTIKRLSQSLANAESPSYEMHNGLVYRKCSDGRLLFFVPKEMEQQLIAQVHERIGHFGVDKCYEKMRESYWFPNLKLKTDVYVKNCIKCILYSTPCGPSEHSLYNIPKKPLPFDTIHIDHFGPLPSVTSRQKHILVIVDAFTKWTKVYPSVSTSTPEVCRILDKYFEYYGRPARIVADRGRCFTSEDFRKFVEDHNIQLVHAAVASPQANGQVERVNRVLKNMLGKLTEPLQHSDWTKQLKRVEFAINNTLHQSIGSTPSKLLFGVSQRGPIVDHLAEFLQENNPSLPVHGHNLRPRAVKYIERSQEYSQKWFAEHCRPAKIYAVGDFVVIKNTETTIGTNKKFIPKFRGPYIVHKTLGNDRYVIRDIDNFQVTQIPYDGVIEARHMKLWRRRLS